MIAKLSGPVAACSQKTESAFFGVLEDDACEVG